MAALEFGGAEYECEPPKVAVKRPAEGPSAKSSPEDQNATKRPRTEGPAPCKLFEETAVGAEEEEDKTGFEHTSSVSGAELQAAVESWTKLSEARKAKYGEYDDDRSEDLQLRVLVARGVEKTFFETAVYERPAARAMLDITHSGDLFVHKVPSDIHAAGTANITFQLATYEHTAAAVPGMPANNRMRAYDNGNFSHAFGRSDVDNLLRPTRGSPAEMVGRAKPFPRLVVELDYMGDAPAAQMARLSTFLSADAAVRAALALRVYPRRVDGTFACAAALWVKDALGAPQLFRAVSFGTAPLAPNTRAAFAAAIPAGLLPPAVVAVPPVQNAFIPGGAVAPLPPVPVAAPGGWVIGHGVGMVPVTIAVPVAELFYNFWDPVALAYVAPPPAVGDLVINLAELRSVFDDEL